ncbi:MAG: curli production assembly protein CsgG [Candidatus Delongbacteria bacterium]|nr:curli production assembly protein CsgG [Candidatus Delongbacteria bacterium]
MKQTGLMLLLAMVLAFQGCATTSTRVENLPSAGSTPEISPVLADGAPQKILKRKVAIGRISNETNYGKGIFYDGTNDRVEQQAMEIMSTRLAATDKFLLLERSDLDLINQELGQGGLERLNIGADYLIVGSVTEFGRKTTGDVGVFTRTKTQTATARVSIRLIDVRTGQIIYAEEGAGEATSEDANVMGMGGRSGYDSSLNDQAITTAISALVSNIVENLMERPWRSYLLAYEEGSWMMSGGASQGIKSGDQFSVYRQGRKIKNPQTGMMIELPGELLGDITVVTVLGDTPANEISLCRSATGKIPTTDLQELYILEKE